jgi:YgiT-type zinc finger domain-containing protein
MEKKNIRYFQDWKGHLAIFENIPALICSMCGEKLFSGETVDQINTTLWNTPHPTRHEEADVYQLVSG